MSFQKFEKEFISKIEKNKSCINLINANKEIINEQLNDKNNLSTFVKKINATILKLKKFIDIEKALKNPVFENVLKSFCESDILIQACKTVNRKAVKWLLTMNINLDVQDNNGMTALMHAVEHYELEHEVESLINSYNGNLEMIDSDENTALFHAADNSMMFNMIAKKTKDFTHTNIDNDSILTYVSKMNKFGCIETIVTSGKKYNPNHINDEYKTAIVYLVEYGRFNEIKLLCQQSRKLNINFHNVFGDSTLSAFTNVYVKSFLNGSNVIEKDDQFNVNNKYNYIKSSRDIRNYARTLNNLIDIGTNFNVPIDIDGNTVLMFFLHIKDYVSALNLLKHCTTLDLSHRNKYGVSASFLGYISPESDFKSLERVNNSILIDINYKIFMETLLCYRTFDFNYLDQYNNNLLNYGFIRKDKYCLVILKNISDRILNKPNILGETSLIVATKLGLDKILYKMLSTRSRININHKDGLGNTALHYAVMTKNILAVYILMAYKANPKISNKSKLSPIKLANIMNDQCIIDAINQRLPKDKINNMCILLPLFRHEHDDDKMESINLKDDNAYETFDFEYEYQNLLYPSIVSPYTKPRNVLTIQKYLSEGYSDNPSEVNSSELFEQRYGNLFSLELHNLIIR